MIRKISCGKLVTDDLTTSLSSVMPKQMCNKVEPIIFHIEGEAEYGLKIVIRLCEDFSDPENKGAFDWKIWI